MNTEQFQDAFVNVSSEVADQFYPKNETAGGVQTGRSRRRGEFIRNIAVLQVMLSELLLSEGVLEKDS
jgi:hypothetical protein